MGGASLLGAEATGLVAGTATAGVSGLKVQYPPATSAIIRSASAPNAPGDLVAFCQRPAAKSQGGANSSKGPLATSFRRREHRGEQLRHRLLVHRLHDAGVKRCLYSSATDALKPQQPAPGEVIRIVERKDKERG